MQLKPRPEGPDRRMMARMECLTSVDRRRSRSDFSLSELLEIKYKHPCTSDVKERERTAIVNS